ncbi:MAG: 1-deoxy-D-xylulose-5-phosphate synthase [Planctomycetota bacterium]|jgi:1-deoxy-D-xylulose-5-phosphate synthase
MGQLLDNINNPDDLKKLEAEQLKTLADELREFILGSVSQTGGHLASCLGAIEVTIALNYVYDFKKDKILWDVGHQCYPHKILTGRKEQFGKLRQGGGVSGFPNPEESVYDQFAVGHAGTSIPTAIGMALGQKYQKCDDKIIAFVGDASIVNGANFEALNNLGLVKRQLLIVLNDNSMAIDATVGAVANYFSRVRLSQTYEDVRKTTKTILEHLPHIGKSVDEAIERIKKSIRMVVQPSQLFESLNIPYFGPVDGHNVSALVKLFQSLNHLQEPAILHIYTKKGKGFSPAEENRPKFHSTGPFDMNGESLKAATGRKTFTNVAGEHIVELAHRDDKIVAIVAAMCEGTGMTHFREEFPDRFFDVGIAESTAVDIAAGMAKTGLKPFVCVYSTFLQRTFDQIFQEVSLQNLPVVFCIDRAGLVGADGPTHHGLMDIGYLRIMPNMVLAAPANESELKSALEFALNSNQPVCIRYPKDLVPEEKFDIVACNEPFKLGKSINLRSNPDSKLALVNYGCLLDEVLEAAKILEQEGVEVDVVNARFATPVDTSIINILSEGKALITIEDHFVSGGFGSAILEAAASAFPKGIPEPIITLGMSDKFIKHNTRKAQLMEAGVNVDNIVLAVRKLLSEIFTSTRKE